MAKSNNRKNPLRNKRNLRRKSTLVRLETQFKAGGYTIYDEKFKELGDGSLFIKNTDSRTAQLIKEIAAVKQRIVQ